MNGNVGARKIVASLIAIGWALTQAPSTAAQECIPTGALQFCTGSDLLEKTVGEVMDCLGLGDEVTHDSGTVPGLVGAFGSGIRVKARGALGSTWNEAAFYVLFDDSDPTQVVYRMLGTSGDPGLNCTGLIDPDPCRTADPVEVQSWVTAAIHAIVVANGSTADANIPDPLPLLKPCGPAHDPCQGVRQVTCPI